MLTVVQPNNNIKEASDDIVNNKDNTDIIKLSTTQSRHDDCNSTENLTQTKNCKNNNEEKKENTKTINTSINVGEIDINMKEKEPKAEVVVGDVKSNGEITSEVNTTNPTSNYDNSVPSKESISTSNFHLHYYKPKEVPNLSKYKIIEEISGGTYGVVYKAEDKVTKKLVALKRMPLNSDREGFSITTIREIKILKYTLPSHTNIIQLLDILVDENVDTIDQKFIYVVFELMDHDLSGLLHRFGGTFSETQIKHYLKQLFNGLDHCHHNKVLHRDLKGANLLINNQGVLKIADFGLSRDKLKENSTYTKDMVTLWFRAPEILLGCSKYSTAIDLWSAGCLLYELYVGVAPFRGNTELEQIRLIFELCGYNKNEPPSYEKCLSVEVNENFTSKLIENFKSRSRYQFNEQTADLLERLLRLDPRKRITANDAITHKYFFTPPLLSKEFIHPRYPSTHDQSARPAKKFKDDKGKAQFVDPNKDAKQANQLKHKPPHSVAAGQRSEQQAAYHNRDAHKHLQYQQARSNPEYVPLPRFSHQANRGQTYRGQSNRYPATNSNTQTNSNNPPINNNNSSTTTQYSNRGSSRGGYNNSRDRAPRDNRDNREKREDRMVVEKTADRVVTDYRSTSSERTVTERYRREEHKSTVITAPTSMLDVANSSQSNTSNAQRRN